MNIGATLQWIIGLLLAMIFVIVSLASWWSVIQSLITRTHISPIPLVGGACGLGAALILPVPLVHRYWWIPLFLDYGSVPVFAAAYIGFLISAIRRSKTS